MSAEVELLFRGTGEESEEFEEETDSICMLHVSLNRKSVVRFDLKDVWLPHRASEYFQKSKKKTVTNHLRTHSLQFTF